MGRVSDAKPRLLEATMDLIWSRSYGAVSVDDICEVAGVKKGSFYHFFKSKDELVAAALDARWEEVRQVYDRIFSASKPPLERFKEGFYWIYERQKAFAQKHGRVLGCPFSSIATETIAADPMVREAVQRLIRGKQRYYESALRDLQGEGLLPKDEDPKVLVQQVYAYVEGVLAQARIANDVELARGIYDGVLKLLGIKEKQPALA